MKFENAERGEAEEEIAENAAAFLWDTVTDDLAPLITELERILAQEASKDRRTF
jgi:hypothetical protein